MNRDQWAVISLTAGAVLLVGATFHVEAAAPLAVAVPCPQGDSLPSGFQGHDIKQVVRTLELLKKDDYESTAAHAERLKAAYDTPGHPLRNRRLCFLSEEVTQYPTVYLKYDADQETFEVSTIVVGAYVPGIPRDTSLVIETVERARDRYEASNAFGATATITQVEEDEYGLRLPHLRERVTFQVPASTARATHPHLRLIAVGALHPPFLLQRRLYKEATITSPVGITGNGYVLDFDIDEFVLFDNRNGKVISRRPYNMPPPVDLFAEAPPPPGPTANTLSARVIHSLLAMSATQPGDVTRAENCLKKLPESHFASQIQELLPRHLGPDILMQLDAFYSSAAGQAHSARFKQAVEGKRPLLRTQPERVARLERQHLQGAISPQALPAAIALMSGQPEALFNEMVPILTSAASGCAATP